MPSFRKIESDGAAAVAERPQPNGVAERASWTPSAPTALVAGQGGAVSVFAAQSATVFVRYAVTLQIRSRIMGGIPLDPKVVEGWLRTKAGLSDRSEELRQATLRTLTETGLEVNPDMTFEEIEKLSGEVAEKKSTNGFKRNAEGLYLESRAIKALIKENVNILFAGQRWLATKKGPRSVAAERIFVDPDQVPLGVQEPSGTELFIGHTSGPSGPKSNLTYYQYVEQPTLRFELLVAEDAVKQEDWARIWILAQENGLGALRSQGFGRFDVTRWDRLA